MKPYIKRLLQVAAVFNFLAALSISFPDSIGKAFEMPASGSPFYTYLLGLLLAMIGMVYLILSMEDSPNRNLILLAAFGKMSVFILATYCWTIQAISNQGFYLAFGDLTFAVLFVYWLVKTK